MIVVVLPTDDNLHLTPALILYDLDYGMEWGSSRGSANLLKRRKNIWGLYK